MDQQPIFLVSSLAGIFPQMTGDEYDRLEESIREVGLLEEITLWRGTVIDGFHRLRACLRLGVEPRFSSLPDDADPLAYVIGRNDSRRSLAPWQRPVAAFKASESSRVGRPRSSAGGNCANLRNFLTQAEAAGLFRVSRRSVTAAARVLGRESPAIPEMRRAVLSGRITVSDAAAAVRESAAVQGRAVDLALRREARTVRQAVIMVKETFGLPEGTESADALPVAANNVPPVFHQSAVAGLHGLVEAESVDAIVTFPPADAGSLLADLADFAAHSLKRTGGLFVLAGTEQLPDFIERLRHPELNWICALHYIHHVRAVGSGRNPQGGAAPGQKLLLVYGKPAFRLNVADGVISALPGDDGTQGIRRGHLDVGMELIISRFTRSGDLVCDPLLLGRKESALAAAKQKRRFIGADDNASRLGTVVRQLDRERNATSLSGED